MKRGENPHIFYAEHVSTHKLFFAMRIVFTLFLLFPLYLFSQTSGLIVDKSTEKGVPFANIWIEDENIGTTSDNVGKFSLNEKVIGKFLIISAVGYERQKVQIESSDLKVYLIHTT